MAAVLQNYLALAQIGSYGIYDPLPTTDILQLVVIKKGNLSKRLV
jgi:hypothetical protein